MNHHHHHQQQQQQRHSQGMATDGSNSAAASQQNPSDRLFRVVAEQDYGGLLQLYAQNASCFVHSYLTMKQRWDRAAS
eukprot:CAMPEP_0119555118 /NCGR_PEP_ID=MMETSP1352-20130426/7429_1 /TAXON_ID=265584 /ORGANISM="Stauroneis constricta, Strain CCMP1120" /LENGTH=77 /DNA_ID=CAMNT_0007601831 /DNA_START=275 /DNA_END=505 /DNA_ORIENTATION=+